MEGGLKLDLEDGTMWPFGWAAVRMRPELGDQVRNRDQSSMRPVVSSQEH